MKVLLIAVFVAVLACIFIPAANGQIFCAPAGVTKPIENSCRDYMLCVKQVVLFSLWVRESCYEGAGFNPTTRECDTDAPCLMTTTTPETETETSPAA